MNVKKFRGKTTAEAMKKVRQAFGENAVILHKTTVEEKRWFGLRNVSEIEVIAALSLEPTKQAEQKKERIIDQSVDVTKPIAPSSFDHHLPEVIIQMKSLLERQGVKERLVNVVIEEALKQYYRQSERQSLDELLKTSLSPFFNDPLNVGRLKESSKVAVFLGPTGVGKTTTIAKVAAMYKLKQNKTIGFITLDTYRIAAVEQLMTYSKILNVPIEVAYSADDYKQALEKLSHVDIIFVDTAGRNYLVSDHVTALEAIVNQTNEHTEYLLTLSLTTKETDLDQLLEQFRDFPIHQLVFTKLDETNTYGSLLNVTNELNKPIAFIGNGQDVPEDLTMFDLSTIIKFMQKGR
ncbi:hypothetical protein [Geomicrobium sediminis]|uniref:Flagellar biosynthesis protein FlhF n=1 Tax=Geomicrobium sediminis TaxID=1347788 RepID=A0ABS2PB54_9BACL|nr:flagellar biosynthesis protein FlhF [Geomicrobium sediminis]